MMATEVSEAANFNALHNFFQERNHLFEHNFGHYNDEDNGILTASVNFQEDASSPDDTTQDDDMQWEERLRLINEFTNWTSGDPTLDSFIQQTQLETPDPGLHMQWIPFEKFADITFVKKGGYSSVYSATWLNKKEKVWDGERQIFVEKPCIVALKSLKNSNKELSQEFLDEFKRHGSLKLDGCGHIEYCHGVTRNPETLEYMLVMNFAEEGDLRQYLQRNMAAVRWKDAVEMLCNVAMGLVTMHKNGTFHRNLHSGNVLKFFTCNISDFGISGPVNDAQNHGVYGSLPFVAPEVLAGESFNCKADIYSFAYIMWELSSGRPPFSDRPHDHTLALETCHGYREAIAPMTPLFYEKLMTRCWDADPENRPDAEEIIDILMSPFAYQRRLMGLEEFNPSKIGDLEAIDEFDSIMNSRITTANFPVVPDIHPFAFYTSRYLLFPNLPKPRNADHTSKPVSPFFFGVKEVVHNDDLTFEEYDTHQPPPPLSDSESETSNDHEDEEDDEFVETAFVPPPPRMMQRRKSLAPPML